MSLLFTSGIKGSRFETDRRRTGSEKAEGMHVMCKKVYYIRKIDEIPLIVVKKMEIVNLMIKIRY